MTGPLTNASLAVQITTPDDDFIAIDEHQPSRKHELCCPHCESPGRRRTSREITITYREIHYICRNPACAHGWVASLNYEYGLSPSGIPDLTLNLPMRLTKRSAVLIALANSRCKAPDPNQPGFFDT